MSQFTILEAEKFLSDVEESAVLILESNLESSEELAIRKVEEFQDEIEALKKRPQLYPESGESDASFG
jgi:hypothetical protein